MPPTTDEQHWPRPVPVIGDASSARERAADPTSWAMAEAVRDALHAAIGGRRDVRRYRPDPVPEELLQRVLEAGHLAPSVGHSQPWRFIVVTRPETRDQAARLADRERLRQAEQMEPDSARRLLDLQLEGIREAPLGVVVCCDRRTPAAGVLGRATFEDADLLSCACAIQNMWLTARTEGLGMGWVTLFEPAELAALVGLPPGVVTLGWLCLGWPDELPPSPGLQRAGWSTRLPLDDVILRERWPDATEPLAPRSHLIAPGQAAIVTARDGRDELLTAPGALGVLDRYVDRVLALGHPHTDSAALLIAAADHPVVAHGISAYEQRVTRDVTEAAVAGSALSTSLATQSGLSYLVVDAGVSGGPITGASSARPSYPQGDLVATAAMDLRDIDALLRAGEEYGSQLAQTHGIIALGEIGIGNTTIAAALTSALTGLPASESVGLGSGADSAMLERKRAVVESALARAGDLSDPRLLLSEVGGPELTVLAGAVIGAVRATAAVVLDGMAVTAAAGVAMRLEPAVQAHLIAGQRSRELGHHALLVELGLEPLLDLRIRAGEGAAAVLATQLLLTTLRSRASVARVG